MSLRKLSKMVPRENGWSVPEPDVTAARYDNRDLISLASKRRREVGYGPLSRRSDHFAVGTSFFMVRRTAPSGKGP